MVFLQTRGSMKEAANDFCIDIYPAVQPASTNSTPGAIRLMRFTKDGNAWSVSVAQKDTVTITSATAAQTQIVTVNGTAYTHINGGSETTTTVALAVAAMLNAIPAISAISNGAVVIVQSRYPGVAYTIGVSGTGSPSTASVTANSAGNGLHMGSLTGPILAKDANNWQGTGEANGIAGWWRAKFDFADDDSTSATFKRMDGACNTANSELVALTTLNIIVGGIDNIQSFNITQPQS